MIERAACDFLLRMARQGRPKARGMSLRIGNLILVFGVPLTVGYYEVCKGQSGEEQVHFLFDPSEEHIARLSGD